MQVKPSAFTENLGTDWLAVDRNGNVLSRGSDEAAVRAAVPDAHAYLDASALEAAPADRDPVAKGPQADALSQIASSVSPDVLKDYEKTKDELAGAKEQIAKMDPDGDGKVGGSKPRAKAAPKK